MSVWKLRGCRHCGGDLFVAKDTDGYYEECLQCGYTRSLTPTQPQQTVKEGYRWEEESKTSAHAS